MTLTAIHLDSQWKTQEVLKSCHIIIFCHLFGKVVLRNYLTITTGPLVLKGWESPPLEYLRSVFHLAVTAAQGDLVLVCLSVKSIIRYPTCCLRAHLSLVSACIVLWIPMAFRNNTWRLFSQDYILCCNRSNRCQLCLNNSYKQTPSTVIEGKCCI